MQIRHHLKFIRFVQHKNCLSRSRSSSISITAVITSAYNTMKKLGFGKKGEKSDGSEDSNRLALFGSRSKTKSPNPSANPYAQPASAADPYLQAKANAYGAGPKPSTANAGPSPGPVKGGYGGMNGGGYGGMQNGGRTEDDPKNDNRGGYGAGGYGSQSGYGADRYGSGSQSSGNGGLRYGAGGYGGLGPVESQDSTADDKRSALFGGAKERLQQQSQQPSGMGQPPPYDEGQSGAYGSGGDQGYNAYGDRQLTAEEEEEEEITATKQEIQFMKREDVSSTRNALRIAAQAEETGRNTLARIGAQGERMHNTEKNLDLTANHNRIAEEKAKELKTLNKSMFAVHVSNPFTASSRRAQRDEDVMDKHRMERAEREATRRAAYETEQRLQKTFKNLQPGDAGYNAAKKQSSLAERAKYQFEADSDDEEMENEIDSNLDALSGAATRLNGLAKATGKELDEQNRHLDIINGKVWHYLCFCNLQRRNADSLFRVRRWTTRLL